MISFDLDMTLLDHRTDQITPSALEAIEKLRPKYKIVLATGRDMDNYYSTSYRRRSQWEISCCLSTSLIRNSYAGC